MEYRKKKTTQDKLKKLANKQHCFATCIAHAYFLHAVKLGEYVVMDCLRQTHSALSKKQVDEQKVMDWVENQGPYADFVEGFVLREAVWCYFRSLEEGQHTIAADSTSPQHNSLYGLVSRLADQEVLKGRHLRSNV